MFILKWVNIIIKYIKILYQSERLGYKDQHKSFPVDESLINHIENRQMTIRSLW